MIRALLIVTLLVGCGRPLTETEASFAKMIHGDQIDTERVRFAQGHLAGSVTFRRAARPRVTCRERILPPPATDIVTASPAAVTLFNRVNFQNDWYLDDYLPDYPNEINIVAAMLFAHEMAHVWQWQNRKTTGYHPLRAASEHSPGGDPYLFELNEQPQFLDFGYEQQGAIVEEYVCCRALAPAAPRTARLHDMLAQSFPITRLDAGPRPNVRIPWKDAKIDGICD